MPDDLKVPEDLVYSCMAHYLAKLYGIRPDEAYKMTQRDFITAMIFEQLEHKRQKFLMEILTGDNK